MTVDSINTSPKARTRFLLRLIDGRQRTYETFSLYSASARGSNLQITYEGIIRSGAPYEVLLLCNEEIGSAKAAITVNDSDAVECSLYMIPGHKENIDGKEYFMYQMLGGAEGVSKLFAMLYGFATIELILLGNAGDEDNVLLTRDIPCACADEGQRYSIDEILKVMLGDKTSSAMSWMLAPSIQAENNPALFDSGKVADASKTLRSYLHLIGDAVGALEACLPYIRTRPHVRILKEERIVDTRKARKMGRNELIWMAKNPYVLHEAQNGRGVKINEKDYLADKVQTEVAVRSFDNVENRAILAFIDEILIGVNRIADKASDEAQRLEDMASKLKQIDSGEYLLPSLMLVEVCLEREKPLVDEINEMKRRVLSERRRYTEALPNVTKVRFRLPRRSKVFQEVDYYSKLFKAMERWVDFGDFDMLREGIVLQTFRMDKLYEYYVLYELLNWFDSAGFKPGGDIDEPIQAYKYSLESMYFENEEQVANFYNLVRNGEQARIYYQPVIYGDAREEAGITLHRTTAMLPFRAGKDSYWTPDFLILYSGKDGEELQVVLDAKFMLIESVRGDRTHDDAKSCFENCYIKYKGSIASSTKPRPDSLWLLCGRGDKPELRVYQGSSWFASSFEVPDGIATVLPGMNMLDGVFEQLGISKNPLGVDSRKVEVSVPGEAPDNEDFKTEVTEDSPVKTPKHVAASGASAAKSEPENKNDLAGAEDSGEEANEAAPAAGNDELSAADAAKPSGELPEPAIGKDAAGNSVAEKTTSETEAPTDEDQSTPKEDAGEDSDIAVAPKAAENQSTPKESAGGTPTVADASKGDKRTEKHGEGSSALRTASGKGYVSDGRAWPADVGRVVDENLGIPEGFTPSRAARRHAQGNNPDKKTSDAKKKRLKQARRIRSVNDIEPDTLEMIKAVCANSALQKSLTDSNESQRMLNVGHPILRVLAPDGREARFYTKMPVIIGDGTYYVYKDWKPINKIMLKKLSDKYAKDSQ